jgi:NAD+ kinase
VKRSGSALRSIRRVALVAKRGDEEGTHIADTLGLWLARKSIEVHYDRETATTLEREPSFVRTELPEGADLAIVVGGDGTLLSVARAAAPVGVPILGVNRGSLGFLTEIQPDELIPGLEAVLDGRSTVEERLVLRVRLLRGGELRQEHAVLNDAVVNKSALARMIVIRLRIDGADVATYTSDGLIISTPTGSTAYSLSAGGPILDPRMSAFVLSPICPHTMNYRPLVVPGNVRLAVSLRHPGAEVYLTLDGQIGFPFGARDALEIDQHPCPARLVRVAGRPWFDVLRRKLRWGER